MIRKIFLMLKYVYLILVTCLGTPFINAQSYWEQLNAPPGGEPEG